MTEAESVLLVLGSLLFVGLATDALGRRTPLPRVTLLLVFGIVIGPAGIDWVLINGRVAVEGGVQRDVRPGRVLRHGSIS